MKIDEKKSPAKRTGRRYASVPVLLEEEGFSPEVRARFKEIEAATRVTEQLAVLRQSSGITQEEMATRLGVTQATVSKLESGRDEDLTVGVIREYAMATEQRVCLHVGRPGNHAEAVKGHALGIRRHLTALAGIGSQDEELAKEIDGFFGEAFFNLLSILSRGGGEASNRGEFVVEFEMLNPARKATRQEVSRAKAAGLAPA